MTAPSNPLFDRVIADCEAADVVLARFLYVDYGSMVRGKATHIAHLRKRLHEGIALTIAQIAMNALDELQDIEGMTPVGEVRLVPDAASFRVLPYTERTAAGMCDLYMLDGTPWEACPRGFLKRIREQAAALGIRVEAVFENEFFLARHDGDAWMPADDTHCFSTEGMDLQTGFTLDLIDALEAQGIALEQALPEYGPGQQEISIRHAELLTAADNQIRVRETVREIARRHGMRATFAAKPWPEQIGSGAHFHVSFWDTTTGENLFYQAGRHYGMSDTARWFVGGVLAHLPALTAITCPTVNSFRRLQPRAWASSTVSWGYDNREAAVRIPSPFWGREQATSNIELKTIDNTCNPYLALGAIVAAGLDGIARRLDPGPAADVDPGTLSADEQARRGVKRLPASLDDALDLLAADRVLMEALGPVLGPAYVTVRRSEAASYRTRSVEFEFVHHLLTY
jgi:glutamine synthetase